MARKPKPNKAYNPHEWVNLITTSGPFPSDELLSKFWPEGLHTRADEPMIAAELSQGYDAWRAEPDPQYHRAWQQHVLEAVLELNNEACWAADEAVPAHCRLPRPGSDFVPQAVLHEPDEPSKVRLLVSLQGRKQNLADNAPGFDTSPLELLSALCRRSGVPLGLVSNGEEWVLIHAHGDLPTSFATFCARDWLEERETLTAFLNLLHLGRFFSVRAEHTTAALFARCLDDAGEVTDTLGRQVREAVEILVRTFDQLNLESGGQLLRGLGAQEIYEGALTVMMRLVLVFCAEDRGLFPRDKNAFYGNNYALSNLRAQLRKQADNHGEELLERGTEGWFRLLANFRLIHGGVQNASLTMPAYGGSLFDPDRFLFLEGRGPGQALAEALPLRVDNRTVLHLLEALQILRLNKGRTRFLDFQTLGPEEVGHVYEGLLDHTAVIAAEPVLGLLGNSGKAGDMEPELPIGQLEAWLAQGLNPLLKALRQITGKSLNALARLLEQRPDHNRRERLRAACGGDEVLLTRVLPFAGLIRDDHRGVPFIVLPRGVYVTEGTQRRNTGTHYTPRVLSEETVRYTLDPLVYHGPDQGLPENQWRLKSPREILDLKICDPAMGSGAFLVQTCRYLSERLVTAWAQRARLEETPATLPEAAGARGGWREELLGATEAERQAHARRLVCTRCLYGVDKNPMAVEMAKLSLWLITLDAQKPFTFLGHRLAHGDSLLGIADLEQLLNYHEDPVRGKKVHRWTGGVRQIVTKKRAQILALRAEIEQDPAGTILELNKQEKLAARARILSDELHRFADLLVGAMLAGGGKQRTFEQLLENLVYLIENVTRRQKREERARHLAILKQKAEDLLGLEPMTGQVREPFHWVLAFPEVFAEERGGFSAMVGNPPFLGGKKITGPNGTDYRDYLVHYLAAGTRGHADLCAYFYLRAHGLTRSGGNFGFIATNTIAQGDTRAVGLDRLVDGNCQIYRAIASRKWPGLANLEVAQTWIHLGAWSGSYVLDGKVVAAISPYLSIPGKNTGTPERLAANKDLSFQGSIVLGMGFVLTPEEAQGLIAKDPRNKQVLFPYLNGEDLNSSPTQSPSRWVINFSDWPLDHETKEAGYTGPVAADFPDCLAIIEEKVKPERTRLKKDGTFKLRKPLPQRWWHYADKRPKLYKAIAGLSQVLTISLVNNHLGYSFSESNQVFAHKLAIFPLEDHGIFSVIQSNFHYHWSWKYSSTLRKDINYSPSDCFVTFPLPFNVSALEDIGERYHRHRQEIMAATQLGLTKTYNRFHSPMDQEPDINGLRRLHRLLDEAVARAYGWDDLSLNHDFHPTKQGLRYTIAPHVTTEILDRLLALNHARYAEEVAAGRHSKPTQKSRPIKAKPRKSPEAQLGLSFD